MLFQSLPLAAGLGRSAPEILFYGIGIALLVASEGFLHLMEFFGLLDRADLPASTLPHGDQRLVEIAMALAQRPELLLVDEPTQGLSPEDTAAFLRWAPPAAGNPCAGDLDRVYVFGVSQSGRFLRHLLYLGLDEAEDGRLVFDAVVPHVAGARRGEFNLRFGQPSLNATESLGSLFPFTDEVATDPVTGQRDGLLARLAARGRMDETPPVCDFAHKLERVCIETVEGGEMTKDLALLVGEQQPWLTTEEFLARIEANLKEMIS